MLAERGPNELSVRDVAARANVNHGLVHRHFGTKLGFVRAIVEDLSQHLHTARQEADLASTMELVSASPYFRVLSRCLLDGLDMRSIQTAFPLMHQLRREFEQLHEAGELRHDASVTLLLAMTVALGMGWALFEPFLMSSMGDHQCERQRLRLQAMDLWRKILAQAA